MKEVIVKTDSGLLQGSVERSIEDYDIYSFKGIPYAKPPIGNLRFEEPQPPKSWNGIKSAKEFGPSCAQYDQFQRKYLGSDDCLYLNVYTKSLEPQTLYPVMMWIHGGAFTFGSGDDLFYGPDYIVKKDVVLVTINFRVGVFGFLNLEDEVAPGNQGFKDQIMALQWIQTNIRNFGGDPKNVTIFGESSGGACVTYLALSPLTKGLFHKVASQSGVALNPWASLPNPKEYAVSLCKYLGKEMRDPRQILEFLKTVDSQKLARFSEKMRKPEERLQLLYPFGPAVDNKSINPVMPIPVLEAAEKGISLPYLLGYNNREGIYSLYTARSRTRKELDEKFEFYLHPVLKDLIKKINLSVNHIRRLFECVELTDENYSIKIADFLGEIYINLGFHKLIKLQVQSNLAPVYFYNFSYDKGLSFTKLMTNTNLSGASHFDELPHLFSMKFCEYFGIEPIQKGTPAYRIMDQMTEMWTNFAKTGNPTPVTSELITEKWSPVTSPTNLQFINLDEDLKMSSVLNIEERLISGRRTQSHL